MNTSTVKKMKSAVGVTFELDDKSIVRVVAQLESGMFIWRKVFKHGGLTRKTFRGFYPQDIRPVRIVA